MSEDRTEQELVRRESLKKLRELGINCYPAELFEINNSVIPPFLCQRNPIA